MKKALITGITGQDGSYLADLLLSKGYEVHGLIRRISNSDISPNIRHIENDIKLHYGDLSDCTNLRNIMLIVKPDEVYNLAAQSHAHVSFEIPEFTADVNAVSVLRLLEAIKMLHDIQPVKFFQASTSEMFGKVVESPQTEQTPFHPRSPYAIAKLFAYWIVLNYRESYNLFACNGIMFNHESPRRGENFVTRKITLGTARVVTGDQPSVKLGNIDAMRDWGHAQDFVEGMWLMLQQDTPDDYVLGTGEQHSVREFCEMTAAWHNIELEWIGTGTDEKGINRKNGNIIYEISKEFYRPVDVNNLLSDSSKAHNILGWTAKNTLSDLVNTMCSSDWEKINYKRK